MRFAQKLAAWRVCRNLEGSTKQLLLRVAIWSGQEAVVRPHGWGDTSATLWTLAHTIALNEADEGAPIALTGELLYGIVYALRTYSHCVPLIGVRYTFTHAAAPAGQTPWETVEEEERELV